MPNQFFFTLQIKIKMFKSSSSVSCSYGGSVAQFYLATDSQSGCLSGVVDQVVVGWSPSAACLDGVFTPCPGTGSQGWLLRQ